MQTLPRTRIYSPLAELTLQNTSPSTRLPSAHISLVTPVQDKILNISRKRNPRSSDGERALYLYVLRKLRISREIGFSFCCLSILDKQQCTKLASFCREGRNGGRLPSIEYLVENRHGCEKNPQATDVKIGSGSMVNDPRSRFKPFASRRGGKSASDKTQRDESHHTGEALSSLTGNPDARVLHGLACTRTVVPVQTLTREG